MCPRLIQIQGSTVWHEQCLPEYDERPTSNTGVPDTNEAPELFGGRAAWLSRRGPVHRAHTTQVLPARPRPAPAS